MKRGEIEGVVNPLVIEEVYHKLLIAEICEKYNKRPPEGVRFIKSERHVLKNTNKAKSVIKEVMAYRYIAEIGEPL